MFACDGWYECTNSESPGYKKGSRYQAYKNDKGVLCLMGSDGYEDPVANLISSFRPVLGDKPTIGEAVAF